MDLENTKETIAEFEGRLSAEVKRQEMIDRVEDKDFRRGELLEKYTARILYSVIVQECGQTWTKVRVKYYNY